MKKKIKKIGMLSKIGSYLVDSLLHFVLDLETVFTNHNVKFQVQRGGGSLVERELGGILIQVSFVSLLFFAFFLSFPWSCFARNHNWGKMKSFTFDKIHYLQIKFVQLESNWLRCLHCRASKIRNIWEAWTTSGKIILALYTSFLNLSWFKI